MSKPARSIRSLALVLAAALITAVSSAPLRGGDAAGALTGNGLSAPVEVTTDRYGIPHVRASNLPDLYYGWGWVSARDRLWQMTYTRAAADGQTHRWLGNAALQADGGAQLFRLRERAHAIWERDRADAALRSALERYCAGVNALLAEHRSGSRPWPPELARLGERPRDWTPEDCELVLLGFGITLDLDLAELSELKPVAEYGADGYRNRRRYEDRWMYDTVPDSAALHMWPPAKRPVSAMGAQSVPGARVAPSREASAAADAWLAAFPPPDADGASRASNQFMVGAGRAARGKPLFANDPHLGLGTPSPFHVVHVNVPGEVDAIGAAVAGLPMIASGRNPRVAWGVTAVSADVIDVYADTLSSDLKRVRTHGADGRAGWADVVTKPFDMRYRLWGPLAVPVLPFMNARRYTPHGPVLVWDAKKKIAYSARWTAFEDDRITLARLIGLERSTSAAEIDDRARTLVTPCLNMMTADVEGGANYRAAGLLPIRPREPGPGPVPSDGLHEWTGFVPAADNPHWRVPRHLFAVNANNRPVAGVYPYALPRYDWGHDRARRMAQRLEMDRSMTLADVASVQNDVVSLAAERNLRHLLVCADSLREILPPRTKAALDTLQAWDFAARRRKVAPTLYRAWIAAYQRRVGTEGLPGLALASLMNRAPEVLAGSGGEPGGETPAVAAVASLATALDTLAARLGPDLATWRYERAHLARFRHPLSAIDGRARWEPPLLPEDGENATPSVGPSRLPWSLEVTHGPVYRHVVDLSQPTLSYGVVPPWNSAAFARNGDLDHRRRWALHDYVPFWLDWKQIEAIAMDHVELRP